MKMKQSILRERLHVDSNRRLHIDIPADMEDEFEVIVLPIPPKSEPWLLSDEERFMLSAYSAVTPEDTEEDEIWEKYLNV
jgi:hypothetical protein